MIIKKKVALITGGARGIGRAVAEDLLQHGAQVCLVDILQKELSQTEGELGEKYGADNVMTSLADITKDDQFRASFEQTVAKYGRLDILVNNASIQKEGLWELMISINLAGTIRGTLLALEFMKPDAGSVVVNMSSNSGVNVTKGQMPLIPVYTTSKAGIIAYTRCFALNQQVVEKKIRIVCLCPLPTDTELLKDKEPNKCWDIDAFYSVDRGRLMTTSEVASICRQLVEDDTNSGKVALIEGIDKYRFV